MAVTVYGLCIGNYQSVLAVCKNGRTEVLANESGERETPMLVTYKDDTRLVGSAAKGALYRNSKCTAVSMLSLLNINLQSEEGKQLTDNLDIKVVERNSQNVYEIEHQSSGKPSFISVQESLGSIIDQLAATALLSDTTRPIPCVLSIPVHYTSQDMTILKQTVEAHGFNVLNTAISPALSLLPYGIDKEAFTGHVLVFDLGTRALTLTIIQCIEGLMRVIATETTHQVGGVYLDKALLNMLQDECKRKFYKDTSSGKYVNSKLLSAAESVKHSLSTQSTGTVYIESLYEGMDFQCNVVRGRFEGICQSIFQSLLDPIHRVLTNSNLTNSDINKIILVGGTCKIPRLQHVIKEYFLSSEVLSSIYSDHVVAMGAAIQGTYLTEHSTNSNNIPCTANNIKISCTDNCHESVNVIILKKNTPLPTIQHTTINIRVTDSSQPLCLIIKEERKELELLIAELQVPPPFNNETIVIELKLIWNNKIFNEPILVAKQPGSNWKNELSLPLS